MSGYRSIPPPSPPSMPTLLAQMLLGEPAPETTAIAVGESGNWYTFELYRLGQRLPEGPGVYSLATQCSPNYWQPAYWGEAANLFNRVFLDLEQHEKYTAATLNCGVTHVAILRVPGQLWDREQIETDLRRANWTPLNDQ